MPGPGPSPAPGAHIRSPALGFLWAGDFAQGLAPVSLGGKYGFIDTLGRMRIPPRFECAGGFRRNRAPVLSGGRWGYVDVTGRMAIPAAFGYAGAFSEGFAPVASDSGYGFIDSNGVPLGGLRYTDVRPFSEGLAAVRMGFEDYGAWGFLDRRGRMAIPPLYTDVPMGFSEGFAVVRVERELPYRSGYIDTSGGFAIDTLYDAAGDFHEGLAPVGRGGWLGNRFQGSWGYVDSTGRPVTPMAFAWAGPFRSGKALVRLQSGEYAWIGRQGRILGAYRSGLEVIPPEESGPVTYKVRDGYGILDSRGRDPRGPAFADAGTFHEGWARVRVVTDGKSVWGYIDGHGSYLGGSIDARER